MPSDPADTDAAQQASGMVGARTGPRLRHDADEGRDRRVSWLELFFDLVFVVLIATLSHDLEEHLDRAGVVTFLLTMLPIWWIWMGTVVYQERFEGDDLGHRLLALSQVMAVAVLATTIEPDGGGPAFALAYVLVRGISVFAWWRAGMANPSVRTLINRETLGYLLSLILWIASTTVTGPAVFALRAAGLMVDLATPAVVQATTRTRFPRISSERAAERFGLFTIIVLGESLARAIAGVPDRPSTGTYMMLLAAVALAFSWWWLYFDHVADQRPALDGATGFGWAYGHLPLFAGIVIAAASVTPLIAEIDHAPRAAVALFGTACALVLLALAGLTAMTPAHPRARSVRRAALAGSAITAIAAALAASAAVVLGIALLCTTLCIATSTLTTTPRPA